MFAKAAMELHKQRINGPFKKVTFIDPFPEEIFATLPCPFNTCINIIAQLFFVLVVAFVIIGSYPGISAKTDPLFLFVFSATAYDIVGSAAQNLNMERFVFVINMISLNIFFGLACAEYTGWYRRRLIVKKWWDRCEVVSATLMESEIQKVYLTDPEDTEEEIHNVSKPFYMLRVKVKFKYGQQEYEATPSIVNRINPVALGLYFETEEECQALRDKHNKTLKLEIDPKNPLDCEIQGYLFELVNQSRQPWFAIFIFGVSVFLFSQLFIKLLSV